MAIEVGQRWPGQHACHIEVLLTTGLLPVFFDALCSHLDYFVRIRATVNESVDDIPLLQSAMWSYHGITLIAFQQKYSSTNHCKKQMKMNAGM